MKPIDDSDMPETAPDSDMRNAFFRLFGKKNLTGEIVPDPRIEELERYVKDVSERHGEDVADILPVSPAPSEISGDMTSGTDQAGNTDRID